MKVLKLRIDKIKKDLNNKFIRNLSIVFSESIITKCLSFISILILSRTLGSEDYGKYSFLFVSIAFMSAFFDFGMENTAVRFFSKEKDNNSIFGLYLSIKIIISTIVILILLIFGKQIFSLMDKSEIVQFLPFLIIGFIGESIFFVNDTYLQAVQKFKMRAIINISRFFTLVLAAFILLLNNAVLLEYVVYLYCLPLLFSFVFFFKYIDFLRSFLSGGLKKSVVKEMFHYEKWMFLIAVPNNTLGRIDFFLISLWVSYNQIGIYNAAFQLSSIVSFIPLAFGKVLLPKMAELNQLEIIDNVKKMIKPVLIISAGMLCLLPLVTPIVPLLLGREYKDSVGILVVMLLSSIIAFAIVPIEQAFYSMGKPMFITVGKYVQIGAIFFLILITVPTLGVIWAAISVLVAKIIYGAILIGLFYRYKKQFV